MIQLISSLLLRTKEINGRLASYFTLSFYSATLANRYLEEISISAFGAVGNGIADDTNAFYKALKHASIKGLNVSLTFGKRYKITKSIPLYSNIIIDGKGAAIFFDDKSERSNIETHSILQLTEQKNVSIKNIIFESSSSAIYSIAINSCSNINVISCKARNASLLYCSPKKGMQYRDISLRHISSNITVEKCEAFGNNDFNGEGCIFFAYINSFTAVGNKISGYIHGIVWWGGDSNHQRQGILTNTRKCSNGLISKNYVTEIKGGGIWGSMGEKVDIFSNHVSNCHDVGIDSEGSFAISIRKNFVKNCVNGCIATFFHNKDVTIIDNNVYAEISGHYLLKINNSSQSFENKNIIIRDNLFSFLGESGLGSFGGDNCENILVQGNKFINTSISLKSNNNHFLEISKNVIEYTRSLHSGLGYISIGGTNHNGYLYLTNNTITLSSSKDIKIFAVFVHQFDFNSVSNNFIKNNTISGFSKFFHILNSSLNPSITSKFYFHDNFLSKSNKVSVKDSMLCINDPLLIDCDMVYLKKEGKLFLSWRNNSVIM